MALTLDGVDDYVEASEAPVTLTPVTMACWFRYRSGFGSLVSISKSSVADQYFSLEIADDPAKSIAASASGGTTASATTTSGVGSSADVWHHAAAVFASSTSRAALLNGSSVGADSTLCTPSGLHHTAIGLLVNSKTPSYLEANIAEVAMWSTALTADEINLMASGLSPLTLRGRLSELVLYQDLIARFDRPGVGPSMSPVGAPTFGQHPPTWFPEARLMYARGISLQMPLDIERGYLGQAGVDSGENYVAGEVES